MLGSLELRLTASIGGVLISDPFLTPLDILSRGEAAMHLVKTGKQEGIVLWAYLHDVLTSIRLP